MVALALQSTEDNKGEFIALLRVYMEEAGIENPNQLYKLLKGYGPRTKNGTPRSASRATIHAYFDGTKTPQPWFVAACIEVLNLNKKKACELALACLRSYV